MSGFRDMLKLEPHSSILEEALGARLLDGKREPCEISCADFDDVLFKLVVLTGQESILTLHAWSGAIARAGGRLPRRPPRRKPKAAVARLLDARRDRAPSRPGP